MTSSTGPSTSGSKVATTSPAPHPYHHGDLRHALVQAAVELAREGGPSAIVLREVARRVGVSPNAAYRHFGALPDLVAEVAEVAYLQMAVVMQAELERSVPSGDPATAARQQLHAVGVGYVRYALDQPGLFTTAFSCPDDSPQAPFPGREADDGPLKPNVLLHRALDGLVATDQLDPADYEAAALTAWAAVHGLSTLLQGPMAAVPADQRPALIAACLNIVSRGVIR